MAETCLKLLFSATNPLRNLHGSRVWIWAFWGVVWFMGSDLVWFCKLVGQILCWIVCVCMLLCVDGFLDLQVLCLSAVAAFGLTFP